MAAILASIAAILAGMLGLAWSIWRAGKESSRQEREQASAKIETEIVREDARIDHAAETKIAEIREQTERSNTDPISKEAMDALLRRVRTRMLRDHELRRAGEIKRLDEIRGARDPNERGKK